MNIRTLLAAGIALALLSASFAQTDDLRSARRERARARGEGAEGERTRQPPNPANKEFLDAVTAGDLEKVKSMLATDPSLAKAMNRPRQSALQLSPTAEIATAILDADVNINNWDIFGATALYTAVEEERKDVVAVLLERGADTEIAVDKSGSTPLHRASLMGAKEIVEMLLAKGAKVDARDIDGATPLMLASDDPEVAEVLLAHGAELNATDKERLTVLDHAVKGNSKDGIAFLKSRGAIGANSAREIVAAARAGDLETVRRTLATAPQLLNSTNERNNGSTMLGMAAWEGRVPVVEFLLQQKADLEAKNAGEQTALHLAAEGAHPEVIKMLLAAGANPKARDNNGETPALASAKHSDLPGFEMLIAADPDLTVRNGRGQTLLHRAAIAKSPDVARLLLERGLEVDARDNDGLTPLYLAYDSGRLETAALLLAHKADVNVKIEGATMLHLAVKNGDSGAEGVKTLIAAGADVNATDAEGGTPLHFAAGLGNIEVAEALVAAGADVNVRASTNLVTPLHMAVSVGRPKMVNWLLDHGADIEAKLDFGDTPLLLAANENQVEIGLALIERGANVRAAYPNGDTVLHYGPLPLVEAVIARGVDIDTRRADGATPLCVHAFNARLDVVKFLLAHGAKADARTNDGAFALDYANAARTDADGKSIETEDSIARKREIYNLLKPAGMALHEAAMSGDLEAARAAIAKDATSVAWKDRDGATPLHIAAHHGQKEVVAALLAAHADVHARDNAEYTAMHYLMVRPASPKSDNATTEDAGAFLERSRAMRERKLEIVELLIAAGADMNATTKDNVMPLDMAVTGGEFTLADLLRGKGAQCRPSANEIFMVTRFGYMDRLKSLIAKDRKLIKFRDEFGRTPVVYAATFGSLDAIKVLLDAGADASAADLNGETALHLAARKGDETTSAYLVEKKAAINARTKEGKTPLDYANLNRTDADGKSIENERTLASKQRIAELLKKNGAKPGK